MREASVSRRTAETDVNVSIALDGTGKAEIATGVGFLDHMLELFARHGLFDVTVKVGRPFLVFNTTFPTEKIGAFDTELVREFFQAFAIQAGVTLHVETLYGANSHHIAESCFKGLARVLRRAVAVDPKEGGRVPSTKGTL
ncbi:MAG: hisB [Microvirga sp.]|nr:hisB [Microvirga sp.]